MKIKRILVIIIILILVGLTGCKAKVPEGFTKEHYSENVKCLELLDKALTKKNLKYLDDGYKFINKQFEIFMDNEYFTENKKDGIVLIQIQVTYDSAYRYINDYFKNGGYDINKKIDSETIFGKALIKNIQELLSLMEIEYEIIN